MKLRTRSEHPEEGTIHFAVEGGGFVGLVSFENGEWYQIRSDKGKIREGDDKVTTDFLWIDQSNDHNDER